MLIRLLPAVLTAAALALVPLPASAGPADVAMLQSYVGSYAGSSVITGGSKPQSVKCRLELANGNSGKITYNGRCSLESTTFSMTGVFAFVGNHYEAAMTSTSGISANVIGQKRGNGVVFSSKQRDTSEGGDRTISSTLALASGMIRVDFSVHDNKTGDTMTGSIPFSKV
ncbi:MAG: hypothetical protein P4M09_02620 [Devosia sp.]|nr:hypothetical protein [Devosia sp.]